MAKPEPTSEAEMELTQDELEELIVDLPVAQRRLITSSADFSVDTLVSMLRDEALIVPPFQRKYVWSERKASRLIESLVLQCPIPVIYLNRRDDEILEVVDGNQRVNSLKRFIDGNFTLSGLTAYPELAGQGFDQLDSKLRRQIKNRTIRCVIIEPESNPRIKFDVFERLNSGSTPLSPQELRHGLYFGPLIQMLDALSSTSTFVSMCGLKNDRRMKGDELVLRFFAMKENLTNYSKPLSSFLSDYLSAHKAISENEVKEKKESFLGTVQAIYSLLGNNAFRLRSSETSVKKFNTAYYDAIIVGFATSGLASGLPPTIALADLTSALEAASETDDFRASTLRATSDKSSIERRINIARDVFNSFT
jgi:uncharacterized protein with ParB-like and HNH nuclease domain